MVRALWQVSSESLVPDFQQPPYDLGAFREIVHHRTRNRGQSFEASVTKTIFQRGASNPRKPPHEVATFTVTFEPRDGFPYPTIRQGYRSKTELALEMVGRAQERGHLKAGWVAADDAFGMSPSFREGLAALGMWYVLDVPSGFTVWPPEPAWTSAEYQGFGRPRKPRLRDGQRRTMEQRSDELPEEAWREITVAEGSQGPRSYLFSAQRVRPTSRRKPGEIHWAVYRRNRDGSEPRYYLSNAPEDTPLETLAYVGGSRWRIETEFETEKSDVGLDEYETRTWAGWHHHVALCLLGGAFLLSLQQAWGEKDAPDHEAAGLPGGAGNAAPGTVRANRVAAVA